MFERLPESWRDPLLFLFLGMVLFLPGLGGHDLWNPDEPRYFQVAHEMSERGEFLVPHLNDRHYSQKPPLLFWLMSASAAVLGWTETAARFPSALAAIAAIVAVYLLGRLFFPLRAARLAALAFATCTKILWQGRAGQIDMLLTGLVVWAVYFWASSWVDDKPRRVYLFYLLTAFATLAKGPVGLLPPLLSILAFFVFRKDWDGLKRLRLGTGLLVYAAVMLAWLVPLRLVGGEEYWNALVFKQTVTRYVDPWHHFKPWYYYLTVLPGDFFPWSLTLPAALVAGWRHLQGTARRHGLFALAWVVVTLVFFSVSPAKRTVYILTMYPALALLVGSGLDALAREWLAERAREITRKTARAWLAVPTAFGGLLMSVAGVALPILAVERDEIAALPKHLPLIVAAVLILMGLGLFGAAAMAWRRRAVVAAGSITAGMAAAALLAFVVVLPPIDVLKSNRMLAEELVELAPPEEPWAMYPRLDPTFLVYSGRFAVELQGEEELRDFAGRPGRVWLLIRRKSLAKLEKPLPLVEVAQDADVSNGYVLMRSPGT